MGIFLGVSLVTIGVDVGHDKHGKHSSFVMVNMLWPHMPLNASRLNKTNVLDNQLHKYKMAKCKICLFWLEVVHELMDAHLELCTAYILIDDVISTSIMHEALGNLWQNI